MSTTETNIFDSLLSKSEQPGEMIDQMIDHFRVHQQPMELFEALKMRIRYRLGLPLIAGPGLMEHSEEVERQLELGLLDACREAGQMLIQQGRVAEGWMYMRPTGDTKMTRDLLASIEINDDNYDEMIQVLLHEGVDIARGYQAVLDHQGTCNSITLYEQTMPQRSKPDQQAAAACLLVHLHSELLQMVREDITQRKSAPGADETLDQMIDARPWVLGDGGYHLDTTHLAATVRIATCLDDPTLLRKAWELTQYGRRLHHQFQYPGEEPFIDFYPAYRIFYSTLLGEDVEAGLKYFERKAKSVDSAQHGTGAIETYVDLLDRIGRQREAIEAAVTMVPDDVPAQRIIPLLIEIAERGKSSGDGSGDSGDSVFEPILQYCQKHNDVLGYAAVLHAAQA